MKKFIERLASRSSSPFVGILGVLVKILAVTAFTLTLLSHPPAIAEVIDAIQTADNIMYSDASICQELMVPGYFYPAVRSPPMEWDVLAGLSSQRRREGGRGGIVIMNPSSGPSESANADYTAAVGRAREAGLTVVAYVYTSYGARGLSLVKADVDKYLSQYEVDGFFFDECATSRDRLSYYTEIANYSRSFNRDYFVAMNFGVIPDEEYIKIADSSVIFEGYYSDYITNYVPPFYINSYSPSKFAHMVHTTPFVNNSNSEDSDDDWQRAVQLSYDRRAGFFFATNDVMSNPYDTLPPFIAREAYKLSRNCWKDRTDADLTTKLSRFSALPIGVNLSPLGGSQYEWGNIKWDAVSTNVFVDIFKHCSLLYLRKTYNSGATYHWMSNEAITWRRDMYPASLPYISSSEFVLALCLIGEGAQFIHNGSYVLFWDGTGAVDVSGPNVQSFSNTGINSGSVNISMVSPDGITVRILRSSLNDTVRNVRLVPSAFSSNYTKQIFQPSFLDKIAPFDLIRFTGWQKIYNAPQSWSKRTLVESQTQHMRGGVAVEHMLDLIRISKVTSVWFSFPLGSEDFSRQFAELLASASLPRGLTIYFEMGAPEIHGESKERATQSLVLFDQFDVAFSTKSMKNEINLMPSTSAANHDVSHLLGWFKPEGMAKLKCVAIPGSFGSATTLASGGAERPIGDIYFANLTSEELLDEVRLNVLVAEANLNQMIQIVRAKGPHLEIVSHSTGPYFSVNNWGYRAGRNSVILCAQQNAFPCSWANTQYYFPNQPSLDAAMPAIDRNCSLERDLEAKLIEVQRSDAIFDIYLDFLRRWETIGGGLVVGAPLVLPARDCPIGGLCGSSGMYESPLFDDCLLCSKHRSLVAYSHGALSQLPYTSADLLDAAVDSSQSCPKESCMWGYCVEGVCNCFAGYSGADCSVLDQKILPDCNGDVGINLAGVVDWSTEWAFIDVFKSSRDWISQEFTSYKWSTESPQYLNGKSNYPERLLPNQKLGSMMLRDLRGHYREGTYVCLYDGDGIITFGMDIVRIKRFVGRIEVTVKPSVGLNNGIFLVIERTNPNDPIRNIRLYSPGFEKNYFRFHPLFMDSLKLYNTLRFMDWMNTNSVELENWADRSTVAGSRTYQRGAGVAIEDMVLLSNALGARPWFNLPHRCSDEYVFNFATLVRDTLRPDLKVFVEYSNEVWGTLFPGGKYAQNMGLKEGLSSDSTLARFCFYVKRSSEIFAIWKSVFGPDKSRLEFVYSSQYVQPEVSKQMLLCSQRLKVQTNATVLAIAPYFGDYSPARDKNLDIFMNTTLPQQVGSMSGIIQGHLAWANSFGLRLATYECGQGMAGAGVASDLAIVANRDTRMAAVYVAYFKMMRAAGVKLMMQFTSMGLYDYRQSWGLREALDFDPAASPKFLGVKAYIEEHSHCPKSAFQMSNDSSLCSFSGLYDNNLERCECYYGTSGSRCEVAVYTEHLDLCGYHCNFDLGVCVPDKIVGSERFWKCNCKDGYYGYQCDLFDCKSNCNFNGICLDVDICSCYPGFKGKFCEVDCGCAGHGVCSDASSAAIGLGEEKVGRCDCELGWAWSAQEDSCLPVCKAGMGPDCIAPSESAMCAESCRYGVCANEVCTCFAGAYGTTCSELYPSRSNSEASVGTNLAGIAYWSTEWVFVDVMKTSSDWISLDVPLLKPSWWSWGNGMAVNLRADGYPAFLLPGQILAKLMLRDVHFHAPSGRYVCLFDGDGVVDFGFDAQVTAIGKNRVEFEFSPSWRKNCTTSYCGDNGILLRILETDPENPIRNMRVIMPGFEAVYRTMPFHPLFLKNIQPYSVLRFMDWQATNNNNHEKTWAKRSLPTSDTYMNRGVALEHMVQLANQLGASPWFCIPHLADDEYVSNFAKYVLQNLRPDVKIYLEYSNEVWNTLFSQGRFAQSEGRRLGLSSDNTIAGYRFYSQRSVEIFNIWKNIFNGSPIEVKYVLSTQTVSSQATSEILSWNNAYSSASFVGIAPYFDCNGVGSREKAPTTALLSLSELFSICDSSVSSVDTYGYLRNVKTVAKGFNLDLITYESGQALVENTVIEWSWDETPGVTDLFVALNRDPRMALLYHKYISLLRSLGIFDELRPLMHYSSCGLYTRYGSWGTIEYTGQPISRAPKYQALRDLFYSVNSSFHSPSADAIPGTSGSTFILPVDQPDAQFGFPAITHPRRRDVWVVGGSYFVEWSTTGVQAASKSSVSVFLRRLVNNERCTGKALNDNCHNRSSSSSIVVATIVNKVRKAQGSIKFKVFSSTYFDGSPTFFIEIRDQAPGSSSNFSDFFSIQSLNFYNNSGWSCCNGEPIFSAQTCMETSRRSYTNRFNSPSQWRSLSPNAEGEACLASELKFPAWALQGCYKDRNGCRNYRTSYSNGTYGLFKPVRDCVAVSSAFPNPNPKSLLGEDVAWDVTVKAGINPSSAACRSLAYPAAYSASPWVMTTPFCSAGGEGLGLGGGLDGDFVCRQATQQPISLSLSISQQLDNLNADAFKSDLNAQRVFKICISTILELDTSKAEDAIQITSIKAVVGRRELYDNELPIFQLKAVEVSVIDYSVNIPNLLQMGYTNLSHASDGLGLALSVATSNGDMTTALKDIALIELVDLLSNVTANALPSVTVVLNPDSSPPKESTTEDAQKDVRLSLISKVLIGLGVGIFLFFSLGLAYRHFFLQSRASGGVEAIACDEKISVVQVSHFDDGEG